MCKARLAAFFIARTDVIPHIHADDRHALIFVNEQSQTIVQHEFFVIYRSTANGRISPSSAPQRLKSDLKNKGKKQNKR